MATFQTIAPGAHYVDVYYGGRSQFIAVGVLETRDGLALVDPGSAASLGGLRDGLTGGGWDLADVRHVLLTHIHLDHAGATGHIVRDNDAVRVYVHENGAGHLVDPSRLLSSARRIYGDQMEEKWGEMIPIPEDQVHPLSGGEEFDVGGRTIGVLYTPGHAHHHVTYLDRQTRFAFVGDVAGQRTSGIPVVLPVTPPPNIRVDDWLESIRRIREEDPAGLFLTHFGPTEDVKSHLAQMEQKLKDWSSEVMESLSREEPDEQLAKAFAQKKIAELHATLPEEARDPYILFGDPEGSWYGLARYWRKDRSRDYSSDQ